MTMADHTIKLTGEQANTLLDAVAAYQASTGAIHGEPMDTAALLAMGQAASSLVGFALYVADALCADGDTIH